MGTSASSTNHSMRVHGHESLPDHNTRPYPVQQMPRPLHATPQLPPDYSLVLNYRQFVIENPTAPATHMSDEESDDEELDRYLHETYGEQDYSLRELTWPQEHIPYEADHIQANNSCELLLTAQDIREGESFIHLMAMKRTEFDAKQEELLESLQRPGTTIKEEVDYNTDLLTDLCQLHHILFGGDEDEQGIEFLLSSDEDEDRFIMENLESLVQRHRREIIESDRLCAIKLLQGRGPSMDEQKLDSILEEHVKLRGYMRTVQTRTEIKEYNALYSQIKENPEIYQAKIHRNILADEGERNPISSIHMEPEQQLLSHHAIVSKLPIVNQAQYNMRASRGRTVVVDTQNQILLPQQPATNPKSQQDIHSNDIWQMRTTSSIQDDESSESESGTERVPAPEIAKSSQSKNSGAQMGFAVVTADPRFVVNVAGHKQVPKSTTGNLKPDPAAALQSTNKVQNADCRMQEKKNNDHDAHGNLGYGDQTQPYDRDDRSEKLTEPNLAKRDFRHRAAASRKANSESESEEEENVGVGSDNPLMRTGVVMGNVKSKIQNINYSNALSNFEQHVKDKDQSTKVKMDAQNYEYFDDEDEDILAQYQQHFAVSSASEDDETSNTESNSDPKMASQRLKEDLADVVWQNRDTLEPESFSKLLDLWKSKQEEIDTKPATTKRVTGRELWRKASIKVKHAPSVGKVMLRNAPHRLEGQKPGDVYSDISGSSDDERHADMHVQTTAREGQSASTQTDLVDKVSVETLVDAFLNTEQDSEDIEKLEKKLKNKLKQDGLSEKDINDLVAKHLLSVDKIIQQRKADRLKALGAVKNRRSPQSDDETSESDSDEENERRKLESDITKELMKQNKRGKKEDIDGILRRAREQQEHLLRQREINRLKSNEELRKKLANKYKQQLEENGSDSLGASEMDEEKASLFTTIQQQLKDGTLTSKEFNRLIESYYQSSIKGTHHFAGTRDLEQQRIQKQTESEAAGTVVRKGKEVDKTIRQSTQNNRAKALAQIEARKRAQRKQ